ncbi:MAG: hypothetical protein ACHQ1H_13360, partial [Nitrososphaerales archaeon]
MKLDQCGEKILGKKSYGYLLLGFFLASILLSTNLPSFGFRISYAPPQSKGDGTWDFQMQNQQNTGYSNQTIVNASNVGTLGLRWSLHLGSSKLGGLSGTPVVFNDIIYVTSSSSIYAINESTGKIMWSDGPGNSTGAV